MEFLKPDENYDERIRQYSAIVLKAIGGDKKNTFANALIRETFSTDFIVNYRWPTIG